jgi:chromopyrrolic acid synthase
MSVLGFPRLHFGGIARIHAPTGARNYHPLVDLSTMTVYREGQPVTPDTSPQDYHDWLDALGPRFNGAGQLDEAGPFSLAKGWDFGGSGHFSLDAKLLSVQRTSKIIDRTDPIIGGAVELWGHHNEYLGTTFNRARYIDSDPSSRWTAQILAGRLTFGRKGPSVEHPNVFSGAVSMAAHARWQRFDFTILDRPHVLAQLLGQAALYTLTVNKDDDVWWGEAGRQSPVVRDLRSALARDDVLGLAVQIAIYGYGSPQEPDAPCFAHARGTIGLRLRDEPRGFPSGRLLTARGAHRRTARVGNVGVEIGHEMVSLNLPLAFRRPRLGEAGAVAELGPPEDHGDLELRTRASDCLVARIPRRAYLTDPLDWTSGILDVPLAGQARANWDAVHEEDLCLVAVDAPPARRALLCEQAVLIQAEQANLFLEHPNARQDFRQSIDLRSFVRGKPAEVADISVTQYYNPRALAGLQVAAQAQGAKVCWPRPQERVTVELAAGEAPTEWQPTLRLATDSAGRATLWVRGAQPGTTRLLVAPDPDFVPRPDDEVEIAHQEVLSATYGTARLPQSAAEAAYDNDDVLGFWAAAGSVGVRVLPNDWHLDQLPAQRVDYALVYREVFLHYELLYSFMKLEVFSLADACRAETYAKLIWQMCDPKNQHLTYYMPPTRDLTRSKARLLFDYLQNVERDLPAPQPPTCRIDSSPSEAPAEPLLSTRAAVVDALRLAIELETAVMAQYTFAAFSVPCFKTAASWVRQGLWTETELTALVGRHGYPREAGIRGVLLEVAHEEMLHFLVANNLLMAVGQPFYAPSLRLPEVTQRVGLDEDLALERLSVGALYRFCKVEAAHPPVRADAGPGGGAPPAFPSIGALYAALRESFERMPELIVGERGPSGGEHHLFLRPETDRVHPDYQLQVYNLESALFGIDFIAAQGEGAERGGDSMPGTEGSHFQSFLRAAELLSEIERARLTQGAAGSRSFPGFPVARNPSLDADPGCVVVTDPAARRLMDLFDRSYALMMQLMVQHFGHFGGASLRRSKLMNASIDVMTGMLRPLGETLMAMPDGVGGRHAGPSFRLREPIELIESPVEACRLLRARFAELDADGRAWAAPRLVCDMFAYYRDFFAKLGQELSTQCH